MRSCSSKGQVKFDQMDAEAAGRIPGIGSFDHKFGKFLLGLDCGRILALPKEIERWIPRNFEFAFST